MAKNAELVLKQLRIFYRNFLKIRRACVYLTPQSCGLTSQGFLIDAPPVQPRSPTKGVTCLSDRMWISYVTPISLPNPIPQKLCAGDARR
jgi:hypothetical protein